MHGAGEGHGCKHAFHKIIKEARDVHICAPSLSALCVLRRVPSVVVRIRRIKAVTSVGASRAAQTRARQLRMKVYRVRAAKSFIAHCFAQPGPLS